MLKTIRENFPLRIIKSSLAILVSQIIGPLLGMDRYFVCIGALKSMRESITLSIQSALEQSFANFIGFIFAMLYAYLFGVNPFSIALAVFSLFMVIKFTKFHETYVPAGVTMLAIMIMSKDTPEMLPKGIDRFLSTLFGIGVALLVNIVIFRPKNKVQLKKVLNHINASIHLYLKKNFSKEEYDNIQDNLSELNRLKRVVDAESKTWTTLKRQKLTLEAESKSIDLTLSLLEAIKSLETLEEDYQEQMIKILIRLNYIQQSRQASESLDELMQIKQQIKRDYQDYTNDSNFFKNTEFLSKLNIYINLLKND